MKKFIISALVFSVFFSCKKNETPEDESPAKSTTKIIDSAAINKSKNTFAELNQEQLASLLSAKKNDTLYVTNFFATWCGPCIKEISHFVEKMEQMKGKPVKFTFVSVDAKEDWNTTVSDFADEYNINKNVVLFDASAVSPGFYSKISKSWDGGSIPFTIIKKGDKEIENLGFLSKEDLEIKINSFK